MASSSQDSIDTTNDGRCVARMTAHDRQPQVMGPAKWDEGRDTVSQPQVGKPAPTPRGGS